MVTNGKSLSMHSDAVYKGTFTHNGTLLKLHENAYTIGYADLLKADGTEGAVIKFGDGVFYNSANSDNKVYAGVPTAEGAVPVFAGIVVRDTAIASGYPAINDEVAPFQKGLIAKEGYITYKLGDVYGTALEEGIELYGKVLLNYVMLVSSVDGSVYFANNSTAKQVTADVVAGRVVEVNPDDKSVTVYISPVFTAENA